MAIAPTRRLRHSPRPRRAFGTHGGGSGILLDDQLARAVRCESALAIRHWWGVGTRTIAWWWRALGVTVTTNGRSRQLLHAAAKSGAAAMRERGLIDEEADERSERAKRLNLAQYLVPYQVKRVWKQEQTRLLGTLPDAEVARMLGLSVHAVRLKRTRLGIPTARDGRRRENRVGNGERVRGVWLSDDDADRPVIGRTPQIKNRLYPVLV